MNISKHISYKEAIRSNTAKRYGIRNNPKDWQIENMRTLAEKVFEPLRRRFGVPIRINSFFRSTRLNKAVGGSSKSQHVKGEAMDIDDTYGGVTNAEMFHFIKDNLEFDQLLWEFGNDKNPDWVHVSYTTRRPNRKQILKVVRKRGRTRYLPWQ